jgi:hypothetical protein
VVTADEFTYTNGPIVSSVTPTVGPVAGGATVTISGSEFTSVPLPTVKFNGVPATSVTVVSSTTITAVSPAGTAAGTVDVTVTTPGGTSPISAEDHYTYDAQPAVTAISPDVGPLAGGATVTISGTGFTSGSTVAFGAEPGTSVTVGSGTSITAVVPADPTAGTVDVTVSTPGGTSATSAADQYTYDAVPTVASVSPSAGVLAGGTTVTISGSGFTGNSTVAFGGSAAASVTADSGTTITAVSPADASAGTVDVTVTTPGGTSATGAADEFTYLSPSSAPESLPTVTSISPDVGPTTGDTLVTIDGSNLSSVTSVSIGSTAASGFMIESPTEITFVTPPGPAGSATVAVTTPAGRSEPGSGAVFTYAPKPSVISVRLGSVQASSSTLDATIDAGGIPVTRCAFQFGRSSLYGSSAACAMPVGTSSGPVSVTAHLTGLAPTTTYHYRLYLTTAAGAIETADESFRTPRVPLLKAPLIGLVVERAVNLPSEIGSLLGIQGIEHAQVGESIVIRCVHGCSRRNVLTVQHVKQPFARIKANLTHALPLSTATRIQIRVSKPGELGRYAVYAFAPSGSQVAVRIVSTGCLAMTGREISCRR